MTVQHRSRASISPSSSKRLAVALAAVSVAASVVMVGLGASPAGAAGPDISCATATSTVTFSPAIPEYNDPTTVTPAVTGAVSFGGCVGLGITGGTASFTGTTVIPANCDNDGWVNLVGTSVITWNNGQTSTVSNQELFIYDTHITTGLFAGARMYVQQYRYFLSAGGCYTSALTSVTDVGQDLKLFLPAGPARCTPSQPCSTTETAAATAKAPGLTVTATGTPKVGSATVALEIGPGTFSCPNDPTTPHRSANLTDTLQPTDRVTVTAIAPLASSTSPEQVCFNSKVPFKSQSNPTTAKPGTAFLLNCAQVANAAPCVTSSKQVGSNIVVTFVLPGGDPRFYIVCPNGREVWVSNFASGKVGVPFSAGLQTRGGLNPIAWKITSGALPKGITLNPKTGTMTGKPTTKGNYHAVVQASDAERPAQKASMSVPITIT